MFDESRLPLIAQWMQRYVDDRKFPGCSVLIEGQGKERYFSATGLCDIAQTRPFTRDTIARIYSMTKPITSTVLMMLVAEGRVHLDARVSDFIPEFRGMQALLPGATRLDQTEACAAPTLHQLLTHTSGLSYAFNPGLVPDAMEAAEVFFAPTQGTLAEMCVALSRLPLAFRPGARWEYSVGIDVIGRVIEVIEGQPLDVVFQNRLLDPLGMTDTHFRLPKDKVDRFAALYTPLDGNPMGMNDTIRGTETLRESDRPETSAVLATSLFSGGGGLVGTIDDYMAFARFLKTGQGGGAQLLSPHILRFMQSNHLAGQISDMGPESFAEQPMEGMGFGIGGAVVLSPARSRTPGSVGDFSWGGMASTFFWNDPVHDMSVVFFTQLAPSFSYPGRPELKAIIHGALR